MAPMGRYLVASGHPRDDGLGDHPERCGSGSLLAIKIALLLLLGPVLLCAGWWLAVTVRASTQHRSYALLGTGLFAAGTLVFLIPVLAWMPWAPARFPVDEAPAFFRLGLLFGVPIVLISMGTLGVGFLIEA